MRALIALLLGLWFAPAWAQVPMTGAGKGTPGVAASYQGPGDVVSGALMWWGLRAYSSAKRGSPSISLCDDAGNNCSDVLTDASTGALANPGTHGSNDCSTSNTCRIQTFYDQTGNTNCSGGTACNATQATNSNRATLTWNCVNGKPCAVFGGTGYTFATPTLTSALSQPYTISGIAKRTANFTTAQHISGQSSGNGQLLFRQVADTIQMYAGAGAQVVGNITDSNWHAFQATFNGTSSVLFCGGSAGTNCSNGGTSNSISPGSNVMNSGVTVNIGTTLSGTYTESGVWNLDFTLSSRQSDMNSNQISYWGPF